MADTPPQAVEHAYKDRGEAPHQVSKKKPYKMLS